jgi:ABC-type uncharacterized transport system substrate-binding protein
MVPERQRESPRATRVLGRMVGMFLLDWFALLPVQGQAPKVSGRTILVVESYHAEYEWDREYCRAIKEHFGQHNRLIFYQMNTKRLPPREHRKMADAAWRAYKEIKPDLVFLGDDAALKLVGPQLAQEPTSVVYLGINSNPRYYFETPPKNMTGVLERPLFKRCITLIKELIPGARRVLVLLDSDLTSRIIQREVFADQATQVVDQTQVDIRLVDSFRAWQELVTRTSGSYDFIVLGLYHTLRDATGVVMESEEVARWTSANSQAPLFGFWSFSIGREKAIGGLVLDSYEIGNMASDLALEIFGGTPPCQISPKYENKGLFLFSASQLAKWRLTLPREIQEKAQFVP